MPWMFGEGNYTVVDNVATLPVRLPNLYRVLTTT
jgi:nitric oxide reductase activation protein